VDIQDGMSHTLLCGETIDNTPATVFSGGSRWIFASDTVMVGLPHLNDTGGLIPDSMGYVHFDSGFNPGGTLQRQPSNLGYYIPIGVMGVASADATNRGQPAYGDENPNAYYHLYRTYLTFKFDGADAHTYPTFGHGDDWANNANRPIYGPGSSHPMSVNHLLCDGSVLSIAKDIDVALYFFMITRGNGDPNDYQKMIY
jgi:hypothetical protein